MHFCVGGFRRPIFWNTKLQLPFLRLAHKEFGSRTTEGKTDCLVKKKRQPVNETVRRISTKHEVSG